MTMMHLRYAEHVAHSLSFAEEDDHGDGGDDHDDHDHSDEGDDHDDHKMLAMATMTMKGTTMQKLRKPSKILKDVQITLSYPYST